MFRETEKPDVIQARSFLGNEYLNACDAADDGGFALAQLLVHTIFAKAATYGPGQVSIMRDAAARGIGDGIAQLEQDVRAATH